MAQRSASGSMPSAPASRRILINACCGPRARSGGRHAGVLARAEGKRKGEEEEEGGAPASSCRPGRAARAPAAAARRGPRQAPPRPPARPPGPARARPGWRWSLPGAPAQGARVRSLQFLESGTSSRAGERAARACPPPGASAPARAARPQRNRPGARDSAERADGGRGAPAGRRAGHGAAGAARWSKRAPLKIPTSPLALCGRGERGAGGAGGRRTLSALTSSAGGGWMRLPAARSRPSISSSAALRSFQFALRARSPADVFAGAQRGSHQRC